MQRKTLVVMASAMAIMAATKFGLAQSILSDQINAVAQAQQQQREVAAERQAAAERRYREEQERIEARRRAAEARAEARQRAEDAARAKIANQDRSFVLEQRKLEIENEELNLKAKSTLVGRENDIINSNLARSQAGTNLVQSRADATKDYAEGTKTLLSDKGVAAINESLGKNNPDKNSKKSK